MKTAEPAPASDPDPLHGHQATTELAEWIVSSYARRHAWPSGAAPGASSEAASTLLQALCDHPDAKDPDAKDPDPEQDLWALHLNWRQSDIKRLQSTLNALRRCGVQVQARTREGLWELELISPQQASPQQASTQQASPQQASPQQASPQQASAQRATVPAMELAEFSGRIEELSREKRA